MKSILFKAITIFAFVMAIGQTEAHETSLTDAHETADDGPVLELTVMVNQAGPAPVIQIPKGSNVHLAVTGAEGHELHLHGYDIVSVGQAGNPAVFAFLAVHTGRFAIVVHGVEDLLGRTEKAVVYLEIRTP
ncbi:hypothetical protein DL239_18950 [Sedimentitalea sp. CY04]|uniref:Cupredoxin-like domain-containing protein n=1 Tax=Parasedimentitalea denitrificans TaxID=2211118 RepID=A0ABX0WCU0_9RHOB|nr:hypothetical protein [Sedimentitalea sp. CY04]NIZ63048.1 hypothetical protein [Sedimentitalea sp. CY04]